jgi:hypothetical protein
MRQLQVWIRDLCRFLRIIVNYYLLISFITIPNS